jgi:hypothetical protein
MSKGLATTKNRRTQNKKENKPRKGLTMTDSIQETTGKSPGISEPASDGVTGPSREVSQPDQTVSGTENTGQEENSELEWAKLHAKEKPEEPAAVEQEPVLQPVRNVFRKTELHGATMASTPGVRKKTRRRTKQSLESQSVMASCHRFEVVFKDLICSLMESQDMMEEDLLLHIADLQQQITALEDRENTVKKTVSGTDPGVKP